MEIKSLSVSYKFRNPYILAAIASCGGLLFGFDLASVSALIGTNPYREFFNHPSATLQSGITASMPAGSFAGALISGRIADWKGRRAALQVMAIIWCIGAIIQVTTQNVPQLVAGRVIGGIGIGIGTSQVPVYIAELSPRKVRGRLGSLYQWSITWGSMVMFFICYGLAQIHSNASFRAAWGIMMVPAVLLFIGTLFIEESPRWYASIDDWDETLRILAAIHAKGDEADEGVQREMAEIRESIRLKIESGFRLRHMVKGRVNITRLFIGVFTQIWKQLTGMMMMLYYIVKIFTMAGYTGNATLVASSIQYVINVVMTIPAIIFIDRWGRRRMMIAGSIICMGWMWAFAAIFAVYSVPLGPEGLNGDPSIRMIIPDSHKAASKAAIAVVYLFVGSFACTWAPASYVYCSELFPTEQRAVAVGFTSAGNWGMNFALSMFALPALQNITWKTYCIFGTFLATMTIHVFLMFPETKGKTLEEVDYMFHQNIPAWRTSNYVVTVEDVVAQGDGAYAHHLVESSSLKAEVAMISDMESQRMSSEEHP